MKINKTQNYITLSKAIESLKKLGYTTDFNLEENGLVCKNPAQKLAPQEFKVDQVFRFEGKTNPGDSSVLYAISSEKHDLKGVLVDAYGAYASPLTTEMVKKLQYTPS